ncbi:MAG TPA: 50S ribosomal protein L19, partial [Thermoanaerobaculia bacterium]|nr:50S ribosomal protein L19 [Thermoanaerobaculia bacterium]
KLYYLRQLRGKKARIEERRRDFAPAEPVPAADEPES